MKTTTSIAILLLAGTAACNEPVAPSADELASPLAVAMAMAPVRLPASGTFAQTGITSIDVRTAGPNTMIDQTATGVLSGTLAGNFQDDLHVVIHPTGRFNTRFDVTCACTVDGRQGTIRMAIRDAGQLISPTTATFSGKATIVSATDELRGLRGVLDIEGTVDVPSGLATYSYVGTIHFIH